MDTKVNECKLISGKEALIALANGEEVEYMDTSNTFKSLGWGNAFGLKTNLFFSDRFKFRLKPHTITLNGIEVPATFKPKEGETYWFITDSECGYNWVENKQGCRVGIAAWRTESEIKQVVAALSQIFGASHD